MERQEIEAATLRPDDKTNRDNEIMSVAGCCAAMASFVMSLCNGEVTLMDAGKGEMKLLAMFAFVNCKKIAKREKFPLETVARMTISTICEIAIKNLDENEKEAK